MLGLGYYWAINRSYDLTYRFQDFNTNALKHNVDLRGKPTAKSDFDFILYGVDDLAGDPKTGNTGTAPAAKSIAASISISPERPTWAMAGACTDRSTTSPRSASGRNGRNLSMKPSDRKCTPISSPIRIFRHLHLRMVASRIENFQSTEIQTTNPNGSFSYQRNAVILHKLPEADFSGRDHVHF